ncbi:thermonuclease family protein [Candidatus Dojkabacteria bacterium]|nr:thermonuclease family protein [Candidatus Dojkabacteria bacterium]
MFETIKQSFAKTPKNIQVFIVILSSALIFFMFGFLGFVVFLNIKFSNYSDPDRDSTDNSTESFAQSNLEDDDNQDSSSEEADVKGVEKERKKPEYEVLEVVDGDTIKIDYEGEVTGVRLIGIDTPETKDPDSPVQCYGQEASDKMKELVDGKTIEVEFDDTQGEKDKYGRLLLYIWVDDIFVNETLIKEGYAKEYTYDDPYKYQGDFRELQAEAKKNNKGLWGKACDCEKGAETERSCSGCKTATVTKTYWNCETYTESVEDTTCTSSCAVVSPAPTQNQTWACNCSKTCPNMSCAEAQYQLNVCGCSARDGDHDGVACDSQCQ